MKIVALNGSPKNDYSITRQHVEYLKKLYPQINFTIISVGHQIIKLENNNQFFEETMAQIDDSDAILWISPIYIAHLPAQMLRFFELIWERKANYAFEGKYCASISTSIHFFDQLAHQYFQQASTRLGMKFIESFSAYIRGLLDPSERSKFHSFANLVINTIEHKLPILSSTPSESAHEDSDSPQNKNGFNGEKILILSDQGPAVKEKVEHFIKAYSHAPKLIDINTLKIKNGCLGCLRCSYDCQCKQGDTEELSKLFHQSIKKSSTIIFACTIKHGFIGAKWKMIIDRLFFNNHIPYLKGKRVAVIFSTPATFHIEQYFKSYCNIYLGQFLGHTSNQLSTLAQKISNEQKLPIRIPMNMETKATRKIIRDGILSGQLKIYRQDYKYFKKEGMFKMPSIKRYLFMRLLIFLLGIPYFQQKIGRNIYKALCSPHKKFLAKDQI